MVDFTQYQLSQAARKIVNDGAGGYNSATSIIGATIAGQLLKIFIDNQNHILTMGSCPNPRGEQELIRIFSRLYATPEEQHIAQQAISSIQRNIEVALK